MKNDPTESCSRSERDFRADDRGLDAIRNQAGLSWVLSNHFTNVQRDRQFDNIVFSEAPTNEFTGRGGVIDFMQKYRLRDEDALVLAERLPIWAEFSIYENGGDGQHDQSAAGHKRFSIDGNVMLCQQYQKLLLARHRRVRFRSKRSWRLPTDQ